MPFTAGAKEFLSGEAWTGFRDSPFWTRYMQWKHLELNMKVGEDVLVSSSPVRVSPSQRSFVLLRSPPLSFSHLFLSGHRFGRGIKAAF